MATSSSGNDTNYDVFLSFRGEDTRYNFTSHLYEALRRNNIKVFIDYDIRRGNEITLAIERVIEAAKMSIIVFSRNYAESTFCLDELLKIMERRESKAQTVLPIFYKTEPSEEIYQEAFARHEQTIKHLMMVERVKQFLWKTLNYCLAFESHEDETIRQEMKVEKWKSAFRKALGLAGEPIDDKSNEAERIEKITSEVLATLKELNSSLAKGEELICTSLVGQTAENTSNKIWECLMNDKISRVGIYGMGGVGKTTIATHINNQLLEVANSFTHIYWVTVSKDSRIYKLQSGIAKKIKLDLSKEDDEKIRASMIRKKLSNEKFLLILDDVWEAYELTKEVGVPPLVGGRKLLLTTRYREVCQRMACQPIEVRPLFNYEAVCLFMEELENQINETEEWRKIMHSVVEECAGLPLAIVVVARRMRGVVDIWKWRNTLRELANPCEGENPEIEDKIYKVLKFSYDRLSNDRCRQCFLYCSLFPEDHEFFRDDLIEYWIGEGLIDELECRQAELDKGNVILDELIHSSLLEYSIESFTRIKMHDVIRDMARINAKVGLQFEDPLESFPNSAPRCSKLKTIAVQRYRRMGDFGFSFATLNVLHSTGSFLYRESITNRENLRLLIIDYWCPTLVGLEKLRHLKIIDSSIESIPDSITSLRNLRVFIIFGCDNLECIPSLVGLRMLQHLEISLNKSFKEIPKDIERLVNLRVLNLTLNKSLHGSFPSGVLEKLPHLQTLDVRGSIIEVEGEVLINLQKVEIVRIQFFNLRKLICYLKSEHWRSLMDYQINYGIHDNEFSKMDYGNFKKGISLKAIRNVEDWNGDFDFFLPDDIQRLVLTKWKTRMFCVLKNSSFVNLQTISITMYESRCLFTVNLAQQLLHNVQQLEIQFCYELVEIIAREEGLTNQGDNKNYPTIMLPNLKILSLNLLLELRSIYGGRMVCPSLELIQISHCNKVERLPFCVEKEEDKQNPTIIKLQGILKSPVSRSWWESLQWDDPNAKSMYHPIFEKN